MVKAVADAVKVGATCPSCARSYKDAEPTPYRDPNPAKSSKTREREANEERKAEQKGRRTCKCGYVFSGEPAKTEEE